MSQGPIYHHYNYCHITTKPTIMKFITSVILENSILCVFNVWNEGDMWYSWYRENHVSPENHGYVCVIGHVNVTENAADNAQLLHVHVCLTNKLNIVIHASTPCFASEYLFKATVNYFPHAHYSLCELSPLFFFNSLF